MKKWAALILTGSAMSGSMVVAKAKSSPPPVIFELTPVADPVTHKFEAVDLTLQFQGEADGTTELNLPNDWAGLKQGYQRITALRATGAAIEATQKPETRLLRHKPNARITVRWRVTQAPWSDDVTIRPGHDYSPIVTPEFFHMMGPAYMVHPDNLKDDAPATARFGPMPSGTVLVSDMQHGGAGRALTYDDLGQSVVAGGDFTLVDAGGGARLAIRGSFPKRDIEGWRTAFAKVAATQRAFWRSSDEPFLVTIMALSSSAQWRSTGGTAFGDLFAFYATQNADLEQVDETLMHEMGYSWVPGRIGGLDQTLKNGRQPEQYWLSEGFTEYVKMRAMVAAGFWSQDDFAKNFNQTLNDLAASPVVNSPNAETAKLFWTMGPGKRIPYLRGAIFALLLDGELRTASNGKTTLDDVLREMMAEPGETEGGAIARLRLVAARYGVDINALITKHIDRGETITLPDHLFAACGKINWADMPVFQAGFDFKATSAAKGLVSGVKPDSAAWRAGLRDGQKLVGWSIYEGDTTKDIEVTAMIDEKPVPMKWKPVSDTPSKVQQLTLDPARDAAACAARLTP